MRRFCFIVMFALLVSFISSWTQCGHCASLTSGLEKDAPYFASHVSLRMNMRAILNRNAVLLNSYIVSAVGDLDDTAFIARRLFANQAEFGKIIGYYCGEDVGDNLSNLSKEYISGIIGFIKASVTYDADKYVQVYDHLHKKAEEIATVLNSANPQISKADIFNAFLKQLEHIKGAVDARNNNDWETEAQYNEKNAANMDSLADKLTESLIARYPEKLKH